MTIHADPPDERFLPILKAYSEGKLSAPKAADEIQAMGLPDFPDPSASEVVLWSRMVGYGIPTPTLEEAEKEAAEILRRLAKD